MSNNPTYRRVEELLEDATFVEWVHHGKNDVFWNEWTAQDESNAALAEEAKIILSSILVVDASISQKSKDELWNRIDQSTSQSPNNKSIRMPNRWLAIAASMAILLTAGFWWIQTYSTSEVSTQLAEITKQELPDGSSVQLNAVSSIIFNARKWETNRHVELKGEGFFEVKKGQKFSVNTDHGVIEVLGTSFNVYARNDGFEVRCYTGKVAVSDKSGIEKAVLIANQGIRFDRENGWQNFPGQLWCRQTLERRNADF